MTELILPQSKILPMRKSVLIENVFQFQGRPISFDNYLMSRKILDCDAKTIFVIGGRQISKSFTWGMDTLGRCAVKPYHYILYIAPTLDQTRTFSNEKIRARIMESPKFRKWYIDKNSIQNVAEKDFKNGSHLYLKAATQGDTIRGISVNEVRFDEIQDIPSDVIPVVEETITGKEEVYRAYAGTAKSLSNLGTVLWNRSSKISPILICPDCRYHNLPYLDNIYEDALRCKSCKGRLSVRPPNIIFKALGNPDAAITGFWIPQLSLPLHVENPDKWSELWRKYNEYPKEQFLNEVLGIPAGNGIFMITEQDLQAACMPGFQMWDRFHNVAGMTGPKLCLYAGVDWAVTNTEGKSFTVLTIGGFNTKTNRFTVVYVKKYMDPDPLAVIKHMARTCQEFQVRKIIGDYGVGHVANPLLAKRSGIPVFPAMYAGDKTLIHWDAKDKFYKVSRTRSILDLFKQIKQRRIHFFRWEEFQYIKSHFLAEFGEYKKDRFGNESLRFDHPPDEPDDALHSLNIMFAVFKRDFDRGGRIFN